MRLYLDANAIIYKIETTGPRQQTVTTWMDQAEAKGMLLTSQLSRMECRILPLRQNNAALLQVYATFFARPLILVSEISAAIMDRDTDLRARYNVKTPDAIHLATAIELQADCFLTADQYLTRVKEVPITLI